MASILPLRRVAVVEEEEIFRRGLVACLADDPLFVVVFAQPHGPLPETVDVAVVSAAALATERFHCPVVLCLDDFGGELPPANAGRVAAVLPRERLVCEQLLAAVRAAAAGLRVNATDDFGSGIEHLRLDPRRREVLRLLAEGADTVAISETLSYSVRTIKSLIYDIERELSATNRAQAVAEAIRQGII